MPRPALAGEARSRRALWAVSVIAVGAVVYGSGLVPWGIEAAYRGGSLPVLNDLITHQNARPLADYLSAWDEVRARWALSLVGAGMVLVLLGPPLRAWFGSRHRPAGASSGVRPLDAALVGGTIGWIGGLLEAVWPLVRDHGLPDGPAIETLWLATTVGGVAGAVAAVLAVRVLRALNALTLTRVVAVVGFLTAASAIRAAELGINRWAAAILALGVGVQLGRLLGARGVTRRTRRLAPALFTASIALAVGIGAWASWRGRPTGSPAPSDSPNVLLLVIDTQRASRMGLYGSPRATTPNLDRLAEQSVTFDRAVATTSWTLPSHASMLTGHWAHELDADWRVPMENDVPTLPEVLRSAGYATGAFTANMSFTSARSGLSRGFDVYEDDLMGVGAWLDSQRLVRWGARAVRRFFGVRAQLGRKHAERVNREFLEWSRGLDRPYFAMLNYFEVHDPYESPPPFSTRFRDPRPRYWLPQWTTMPTQVEGDAEEMLDAYDSALAYLDHHIGALFGVLEERGDFTNTILIVTSDHGEHFAERNLTLHANSLYWDAVRVPLILRFPDRIPGGHRSEATVSIRDIPATVLELADISVAGAPPIPGRSLSRYWTASGPSPVAEEPVYLSLTFNGWFRENEPIEHGDMRSVVLGSLHYIRNGDGTEELFDLVRDPEEQNDLAGDPDWADRLLELRALSDETVGPAEGDSPP